MSATMDAEKEKRQKIMAIMRDQTLTPAEKSRQMQALQTVDSKWAAQEEENGPSSAIKGGKPSKEAADGKENDSGSASLDENLKCAICLSLCERPVTAPCQHNFCLSCFNKWGQQGKRSCPTCRAPFPQKFAQNPRINTALTIAIRLAKNPVKTDAGPAKDYKRIDNESRPDEAFVTERAQRTGRANAASGRIMVSIPNDHFGPILPEHDPVRNLGVQVGDHWKDRLDCRQWGAHFPHVAGIAGQSGVGAQSVVLSGGYEDDRDEGEWFLYTGSGGRDLSGNKRTSKVQSFDQKFESMNKALLLSCTRGLPVRVVRSFKEKRSSYAPTVDTPVRYDGVYRILRCWRKAGIQKHLVCRYLFVRCDNSPAPWSSAETGDLERLDIPAEAMVEIRAAVGQVHEMTKEPLWGYLADEQKWGWAGEAPPSQKVAGPGRVSNQGAKLKKKLSEHEKALKGFHCGVCKALPVNPLSTPCGHNFCRGCLDKRFEGISDVQCPTHERAMRVRRNLKPCPACQTDLCDFLNKAQINREMVAIIEKLQEEVAKVKEQAAKVAADKAAAGEKGGDEDEEGDEGEDEGEEGADEGEQEEGEEEEEADGGAGPSTSSRAAAAKAGLSSAPSPALALSGPSSSAPVTAAAASPASQGVVAPSQAQRSVPYQEELDQLASEFPGCDRGLIQLLLEDQGGDILDVRVMLKKTQAAVKASSRSKTTTPKAAPPAKGKKGAAAAGGRKRKAKAADKGGDQEEGEEGEEEEPIEDVMDEEAETNKEEGVMVKEDIKGGKKSSSKKRKQ